ncbi:hypothetical protein SAMN05192541_109292 [Bradyrhizobium arachidis]|nr:hypothetical protein SAMN05192541_109292 [Bradyrhizobium arachidis]
MLPGFFGEGRSDISCGSPWSMNWVDIDELWE